MPVFFKKKLCYLTIFLLGSFLAVQAATEAERFSSDGEEFKQIDPRWLCLSFPLDLRADPEGYYGLVVSGRREYQELCARYDQYARDNAHRYAHNSSYIPVRNPRHIEICRGLEDGSVYEFGKYSRILLYFIFASEGERSYFIEKNARMLSWGSAKVPVDGPTICSLDPRIAGLFQSWERMVIASHGLSRTLRKNLEYSSKDLRFMPIDRSRMIHVVNAVLQKHPTIKIPEDLAKVIAFNAFEQAKIYEFCRKLQELGFAGIQISPAFKAALELKDFSSPAVRIGLGLLIKQIKQIQKDGTRLDLIEGFLPDIKGIFRGDFLAA